MIYNGTTWIEHKFDSDGDILDIWGKSPTDIWAIGMYGVIYHYDGSTWTEDRIFRSDAIENNFQLNHICEYGGNIYIKGFRYINEEAKNSFRSAFR